jgi:hypothetical protein
MNLLPGLESDESTHSKRRKHHHITSQRHYAALCDSYTVGSIALPINTRFLAMEYRRDGQIVEMRLIDQPQP